MAGDERQRARRHFDTIVIGAGMSGLACAAKLLDHPTYQNHKSLLVLEARDRIGGRIGSVVVNGNRLDTGANWIHGIGTEAEPNPLVSILPKKDFKELDCSVSFRPPEPRQRRRKTPKNDGLDTHDAATPVTQLSDSGDWVWIDPETSKDDEQPAIKDLVIPPKIASTLFGAIWGLISSLHELAVSTAASEAKRTSIIGAIKSNLDFKAAFDELPKEYHATLRALPQFIESMEAGPLWIKSPSSGCTKAGLGLLEFAIDDFDGAQVFLRDGYTAVVEEVGKKVIEQGQVKLDVEVSHITWDGESVEVTTNDGTYTAKRVVCTLPLGVLQHHESASMTTSATTSLFSPPLPDDKREAIQSLGFGTLDKIFLVYSHPWWTDEPWSSILKKGFTRMHLPRTPDPDTTESPSTTSAPTEPDTFWGFTTSLPGLSISPEPYQPPTPGPRSLSLMNLHALTGFPVLSAFISCDNAHHIESLPDSAAATLVHSSLTQWLGRPPPKPTAVHVTRWHADPYSRGSYSHMITNLSETRHREVFSHLLVGERGAELRFAGEHTSRNHFATVHGALLSGWREADGILAAEES